MYKNLEDLLKRASLPITEPFPSVADKKKKKLLSDKVQQHNSELWSGMKGTKMTPELEKDLKLLTMRNALDSSNHYKAGEKIGQNKDRVVQVGTILEGSGEFYSGRLTRKQRKTTLLDTLLHDEERKRNYKNKFMNLQKKNQSGSLRNYKQARNTRLKPHKREVPIKYEKKK